MTDRRELEHLIKMAAERGASVTIGRSSNGDATYAVSGLKGVGPFPMAPISFAERMREVLR